MPGRAVHCRTYRESLQNPQADEETLHDNAVPANGFSPDNANLSPFMQRLARAHANCIEGLPIFGGLMLVAMVTGRTAVTDPLALVLLGARIVQSCIHLASLSPMAVTLRFTAFSVQLAIALYWVFRLLWV